MNVFAAYNFKWNLEHWTTNGAVPGLFAQRKCSLSPISYLIAPVTVSIHAFRIRRLNHIDPK